MAIEGVDRGYDQQFMASFQIDGLDIAWFSKIGALESEVGVVEQNEGGSLRVADKQPGKIKWSPLELEVGVTNSQDLKNWFDLVVNAANDSGATKGAFKKNCSIVVRDRDKTKKRQYNIYGAWPSKLVYGEWDAGAEENVIEKLTIQFDWAERVDKAA